MYSIRLFVILLSKQSFTNGNSLRKFLIFVWNTESMPLLKLLAELAPKTKTVSIFFFFCPRQVHVEKRILWRTKDQGINCCSVHSTKLTKANQLQVIISDGVTERVRGLYCTVSYGPGFFPLIYGPSAKKRQGSITYSKAWENEVSKIFIISPRLNFEI